MGESFVDLSYRGLDLGRRLKLRDVRAETGYVEIPLPMPVGTRIEVAADDGVRFEALVTQIHEQIGGSDQVPGMRVKPTLSGAATGWWEARVDRSLPPIAVAPTPVPVPVPAPAPEPPPAVTSKPTMVMSAEMVQAALAAADSDGDGYTDDGKRTEMMAAVSVEAEVDTEVATEKDIPVVDDGKRTTVMDAIDVSLITGRANSEIGLSAMEDDETEISIEAEPEESSGEVSGEIPTTASGKVSAGNGRSKRNTTPPGAKKRGSKKKR